MSTAHAHAHTHTQLDHLGALCNHLEEASACFVTHPGGFYSDNLRNYNLSPEGEYPPCSVMWSSNSSGSNAYQWEIHFLLKDFLEVIDGLFADGRLNAMRQQDCLPEGVANDFEVYLAGDFKIQRIEPDLGGPVYYKISYTACGIRMFTLVKQEGLGNTRRALERYGVQLPDSLDMRKEK